MGKYKKTIAWILIIFVAASVRFYKPGEIPSGLYLDEASIGYNAYSILQTGKDEFGKSYPLVFRSFNDFKTPVYVYLSIPFIKLFGLSILSVRLLSTLASLFTIPLIYLLVKILTKKESLSMISAAILAITPWHILFGRVAFEVNLSVFFFVLATYLFYLGLKKPKVLLFSAVTFAITITSYHAQRLIVPLFLFVLFLRHKKLLFSKKFRNIFLSSLILGFIMLIPTLSVSLTSGFLARAEGLNIFNSKNHTPSGYIDTLNHPATFLINSKLFLSTKEFLSLYFSYFSPRNLFVLGDPDSKVSIPGLSTFYIWMAPLYLVGLYFLIKKYKNTEFRFLTLLSLLIFPLPAAFTGDPFSTIRAFPLVIPLTIIISIGMLETYLAIQAKFKKTKIILIPVLLFMVVYSILKLYSTSLLFNHYRAKDWNFGFKELTQILNGLDPDIPVVIDNARVEPYSEILFFSKFDPNFYQRQNKETNLSEYYTNLNRNKHKIIGKIETRGINWEKDTHIEQYLVGDNLAISNDQIIKNNLTLIIKVLYPDKSTAFVVVKTNPLNYLPENK